MLAYVDESGCAGMKIGGGSTPIFAVCVVFFEDRAEGDRCFKSIASLRREHRRGREFHFSKCNHEQRLAFFRSTAQFDYRYFGVVVDKAKLQAKSLELSKPFLQYPVMALFSQFAPVMNEVSVTIDRTGSSQFRKALSKELKRDLNEKFQRNVIKQVKDEPSHKHNLLQLADMVCSGVARSFRPEKKECQCYREMIQKKEWQITVWP